jgi:hypothetical protein
MRYRVHRFNIRMTRDQGELERFINGLPGEVVAVIPNVAPWFMFFHRVDFVFVVERTS